jgi:hypothetical protein
MWGQPPRLSAARSAAGVEARFAVGERFTVEERRFSAAKSGRIDGL